MEIKINKNLMSINHTVKKRSNKDIEYIFIHYVGALGDAKANTDYYKNNYVGASADFWVGHTGDIWQGNDYRNYYSWAVGGSGSGAYINRAFNSNSVSIEMCVKKRSTKTMSATDRDWYFENATVESTAKLTAYLMKELDINIDHVIRHYDRTGKICPNPFVYDNGATTWKQFKEKVSKYYSEEYKKKLTKSSDFKGLTEKQAAAKILELAREDHLKTGVLASVTAAQMILESGYVTTELATKANNCFGMKEILSGNAWGNSTWDGKSTITIKTAEEYKVGEITYINAKFRKYPCIEDSIADHSAYLLGAMNGNKLRYDIKGLKDYKKVAQLIKDGGYATDSAYVAKLCNIIERFGLDKYDDDYNEKNEAKTIVKNVPLRKGAGKLKKLIKELPKNTILTIIGEKKSSAKKTWYKVKLEDGTTGYVYHSKIKKISFTPYTVKVTSNSLYIRSGASTRYSKQEKLPKGTYTIVAEKEDSKGRLWGLLKSYEKNKDGWIAIYKSSIKKVN